jgi:hypothetical protein
MPISLEVALEELEKVAPAAPFLALGQTIFWDEPIKGALLLASHRLGYKRRLVAGVHDTDYFAKLPSGKRQPGKYKAFPHNDTSTKGLWSAAAEFSTLFGSETVISRDVLHEGGLRIGKLLPERPHILDEATEAWGWRGIVSLDDQAPVSGEVPIQGVFKELYATLEWAVDGALECITGSDRDAALALADELKALLCEAADNPDVHTLGELYLDLIGKMYDFCARRHVDLTATTTTQLLRFNTQTADLPRFGLVDRFLENFDESCQAYNDAVAGSEIYPLERFGTGAIPFDLVVPGQGRGTIRIGNRAVVVMTPRPIFLNTKSRVRSVAELAAVVEGKLGPECTLVGKAVTLIGMLASEFVFVFHHGASSYVKHSRKLLTTLGAKPLPILRLKYSSWDEMDSCCAWLRLPEPFRGAFGAEEICAPNFALRWRQVVEEQERLLERLGQLRRPTDLIRFLQEHIGGAWSALADEYERIHGELEGLRAKVDEVRAQRHACYDRLRQLKRDRVRAERAKGEHFREYIFEREATPDEVEKRAQLTEAVQKCSDSIEDVRLQISLLNRKQRELVEDAKTRAMHERRRTLEVEAELKRLNLIRTAVIAGRGLQRAGYRPSAWWFPLLCPDGLWLRATVENAECELEPLTQ